MLENKEVKVEGTEVEEFDARRIKIQTVAVQRELIAKQLSHTCLSPDGSTEYSYAGHVYPENIQYFENNGWTVKKIESEMLTIQYKGAPVYLFTVSDDIVLTEEEMEEAEEYVDEDLDLEEWDEDEEVDLEYLEKELNGSIEKLLKIGEDSEE